MCVSVCVGGGSGFIPFSTSTLSLTVNVLKNFIVEQNEKSSNLEHLTCKLYQVFIFVCFVCFVALRPKSTAMVMPGGSVHLTTLFLGQA